MLSSKNVNPTIKFLYGSRSCLASAPGLPHFDLPFAFMEYTEYTESEDQIKRGRPGSIHHVNDIRWMRGGREVDVG